MTAPTRPLSRWHWQNWPVLVKLIGVLLVPTVVALVVGALRIVDQAAAAPQFERTIGVAGVQQQLSGVVTAVQDERDLAAAFVAGGRQAGEAELTAQYGATDEAIAAAREGAAGVEGIRFSGYRAALDRLGGLAPLREGVVNGVGPADIAVSEYGAAIEPLVDADAALARSIDDAALAGQATALHALLAAREQVERQHALIAPALIADEIGPGTIEDVRAAGVRLDAELESFAAALTPAARERFLEPISGAPEQARQRIVTLVVDRGLADEPPATPPADWDARTAAVVEPMTVTEGALRDEVAATATTLRDDARGTAGLSAVLLVFALALGVVVSYFIARSMLRPLGMLRRSALDVADKRLPAAAADVRAGGRPKPVEPVPVHTTEEIGQVARAFDAVHSQAVRLAAEQAQLRANVSDMFVNLSRRSQGLVQRQLKLIDELESGEESPETLANLFQLDHLATRMRRNSENLLVLAGTESATRSGRPVRLVDVLRAAVSEVEQYQRLVLQPPPDVLVLGRAAADLVHLLAEVLDNATMFSPPDSQVMISARTLDDDGGLVVEVDDRGVGMADAELADANARLATSPTVDTSVSRRMGLFVVGRLAARHDIGVTLGRGHDEVGVTAAIALPTRLVRTGEAAEPLDGGPVGVPSDATEVLGRRAAEVPPAAANGNGTAAATTGSDRNGTGDFAARPVADWAPEPPLGSGPAPALPRRAPDRVASEQAAGSLTPPDPRLPEAAPGVTTSWDLFRSASAEGVEHTPLGVARVAQRAKLDHATPIFDDVASAWFKENKPVPVQWSQEAPAPEPEPALAQREPGQALVEPGETADERDAVPVSAAAPRRAERAQAPDWGAGDAGWQAAEALTRDTGGEVTRSGLPRRQPRALLVPGAADSAVSGGGAPARSPEAVRGRLASYQRGVQEGRQVRQGGETGQESEHGADDGSDEEAQ